MNQTDTIIQTRPVCVCVCVLFKGIVWVEMAGMVDVIVQLRVFGIVFWRLILSLCLI